MSWGHLSSRNLKHLNGPRGCSQSSRMMLRKSVRSARLLTERRANRRLWFPRAMGRCRWASFRSAMLSPCAPWTFFRNIIYWRRPSQKKPLERAGRVRGVLDFGVWASPYASNGRGRESGKCNSGGLLLGAGYSPSVPGKGRLPLVAQAAFTVALAFMVALAADNRPSYRAIPDEVQCRPNSTLSPSDGFSPKFDGISPKSDGCVHVAGWREWPGFC